jgi:cytochrome c-type biogenesis protein
LYGEWKLHPRLARLGPFAAPIAGAAFAFGWTPCVGPILASVLALSADQGHVAQGAFLLAVYSLGLGVPFLAVAIFFDRVRAPLAWLRRHSATVTAVSATLLLLMGVLLVLDRLSWLTTQFERII